MMAFVLGSPVEYDKFYKTARWKRLRKLQLTQHPLCKFCLERGAVEPATVVDHVKPHNGNWTEFVTGNYSRYASRATSRRSGRLSCVAIVVTSGSMAFPPIPITRSTARADLVNR